MFARNSPFLLSLALIGAAVALPVKADQWDKKTTITITEPVQMPACCNTEHIVVLQPGTYVMALVDLSPTGTLSGCLRRMGQL